MRLVHAAYLFNEKTISIPRSPTGKAIFKLGTFAKENRIEFDEDEAHDALYDVRKTIEVAQLIKEKAPIIWDVMLSNTNKNTVIDFIKNQDVFASGDIFFNKPYRWLMTACGFNNTNSTELGVFDLTYDPEKYLSLSVDQLIEVLKKSPKVIRSLRTNAQPFALSVNKVAATYYEDITISIELAQERAQKIKDNHEFQKKVGEALAARFETQEISLNVEENLYSGFPSYADKDLMVKFHNASPEERCLLIGQFADDRYKQIARRLVYFETPEVLSGKIKKEMDHWITSRIKGINSENKWRTISQARIELDQLKQNSENDDTLIQEINDFLNNLDS